MNEPDKEYEGAMLKLMQSYNFAISDDKQIFKDAFKAGSDWQRERANHIINQMISELRKALPKAPKMDGIESYSYSQRVILKVIEDALAEYNGGER